MIKEALEYITGLANTKVTEVGGRPYSNGQLAVIKEPTAATITVNSLSGLVDYLTSQFDGIQKLMVHIENPTTVSVYTEFNRDKVRDTLIQAKAMLPSFRYGSFLDVEEFNIALQSVFVTNDDRDTMLKIVGNIKDDNVTTFGDDGVSQQVKTKTGVATVADVKVPNPVYLKPYRTFVEVNQPESAFVFRMRSGPTCALFEADGGAWKVEAMDTVRKYLEEALAEQIKHKSIVLIA